MAGDDAAVAKLLPGPHALLRCLITIHPGKAWSTLPNMQGMLCANLGTDYTTSSPKWHERDTIGGLSLKGVRAMLCMLCSSQNRVVVCIT